MRVLLAFPSWITFHNIRRSTISFAPDIREIDIRCIFNLRETSFQMWPFVQLWSSLPVSSLFGTLSRALKRFCELIRCSRPWNCVSNANDLKQYDGFHSDFNIQTGVYNWDVNDSSLEKIDTLPFQATTVNILIELITDLTLTVSHVNHSYFESSTRPCSHNHYLLNQQNQNVQSQGNSQADSSLHSSTGYRVLFHETTRWNHNSGGYHSSLTMTHYYGFRGCSPERR
jgi:hypothetical protein